MPICRHCIDFSVHFTAVNVYLANQSLVQLGMTRAKLVVWGVPG